MAELPCWPLDPSLAGRALMSARATIGGRVWQARPAVLGVVVVCLTTRNDCFLPR